MGWPFTATMSFEHENLEKLLLRASEPTPFVTGQHCLFSVDAADPNDHRNVGPTSESCRVSQQINDLVDTEFAQRGAKRSPKKCVSYSKQTASKFSNQLID